MTRGTQSPERFRAAPRKRLAALVLRRSVSMKPSVAPSLSIARYRYFQRPFTRTYVSSTRPEKESLLRYQAVRFSSSGA
jgi:hypothetical protein